MRIWTGFSETENT